MAKQIKQPVYEEQAEGSGAPLMKVLFAIACFGLAVLIIYIAVAPPQPEMAMGAIRDVLRGLCGSMSPLLALIMVWIGVLLVFSVRGKKLRIINIIANSLLFLCAFTAVQLFATPKVSGTMKLTEFFNFVSKSYRYGGGGGAIGSLLAWPLYNAFSKWGGLIVVLLIVLLCLVATGRAQKFYRWTMNRAEEGQHHMDQRRKQKNVERLFDYNTDDYDEYDGYAPRQRRPRPNPAAERSARRSTRSDRDYMIIETPAPAAKPARRAASPASGAPASRKKLYKETIDPETAVEEKKLHGVDIPRPMREIRKDHPDGIAEELPEKKPRRSRSKFPKDIPDFFNVEEESKIEDILDAEAEQEEFIPRRSSGKKPRRVVEGVQPLTVDGIVSEQEPEEEDEAPFDIPHAGEKKAPRFSRRQQEAKEESYPYPPMSLLPKGYPAKSSNKSTDGDLYRASKLIKTLQEFGVDAEMVDEGIVHGPTVTCFKIMPGERVPVERITKLERNIMLKLAAKSIRIEAPIPGESAVGIEIPNAEREIVHLRDVLEAAKDEKSKLLIALGKNNNGEYIYADIAKMPHLLVGGQTGSGKSVCMNTIITSILYRATPDEVRMIMIDPKRVELSVYADIPHLIAPVITDPKKAVAALDWAVAEMDRRYDLLQKAECDNIDEYNQYKDPDEPALPKILIIIDEFADLMIVAANNVEEDIQRITQLARACGVHLIIGTQRPEVKYVPGSIKANIPCRMAFKTAQYNDSKTILDCGGAEKLLGKGDMLYIPPDSGNAIRMQCAWADKKTAIKKVVQHIKDKSPTLYDEDVIEKIENSSLSDADKEEKMLRKQESDPLLSEVIEYVIEAGQASTSSIQRHFRVGYSRAGSIMDEMEQRGIVSEANGSKPRNVLITREQFYKMFSDEE